MRDHPFNMYTKCSVKEQKTAKDDKKILSVALHISGTIYHMIVIIYVTHV